MSARRRQGFTLIEILVVLGVLIVLVGMAAFAYQRVNAAAGNKATMTQLEMCRSVLNEYELNVGTLNAIQGNNAANKGIYYQANGLKQVSASSIGDVNMGNVNRWSNTYVMNTGTVFYYFQQVPSAKLMLAQMPPSAFLASTIISTEGNGTIPLYYQGPIAADDGVWLGSLIWPATGTTYLQVLEGIPSDAWRNPIVLIPSGGLLDVYVGGPIPPNAVPYSSTNPTQPPLPTGVTGTFGIRSMVVPVDQRPFFVSAGPDGNFQAGDDNLYSSPVIVTPH